MTDVEIRTHAAAAGASSVLARATELLLDGTASTDDVRDDGRLDSTAGALSASDVATGAGALVAKLLLDVERVLNLSRAETLHQIGLWVATQEPER